MATTPIAVTTPEARKSSEIAPRWHTAVLVVVLLAFSFATARTHGQFIGKHGRMPLYLGTIVWEYVLVAFVCFGVWRRGGKVRELIGGRWKQVEDFLIDVAIAAGFWLVSAAVLAALSYVVGLADPGKLDQAKKSIQFLLPQGTREMAVWVFLSITAGLCEEIIFRGYFQRQFTALSGNAAMGIVIQGLLFGAGHGYEGFERMFIIAVWGMMFGMLAYWRKSLRPGMMTHAFHDGFIGLLGSALLKSAR
jgi:membrane protease YdiL (CAAX protease family)